MTDLSLIELQIKRVESNMEYWFKRYELHMKLAEEAAEELERARNQMFDLLRRKQTLEP